MHQGWKAEPHALPKKG